ncbi:hypothetical protein [Defluviimonas sp. WL0050]|uniref:hypothetical protein n=1 Tax=Albidovulum litorale TaxID=2984134 RepID=UPI0021E79A35|nr:hypothetical protein [Defluviimonas sp. WL0050]
MASVGSKADFHSTVNTRAPQYRRDIKIDMLSMSDTDVKASGQACIIFFTNSMRARQASGSLSDLSVARRNRGQEK